jgi:hypothetical protein
MRRSRHAGPNENIKKPGGREPHRTKRLGRKCQRRGNNKQQAHSPGTAYTLLQTSSDLLQLPSEGANLSRSLLPEGDGSRTFVQIPQTPLLTRLCSGLGHFEQLAYMRALVAYFLKVKARVRTGTLEIGETINYLRSRTSWRRVYQQGPGRRAVLVPAGGRIFHQQSTGSNGGRAQKPHCSIRRHFCHVRPSASNQSTEKDEPSRVLPG